MPAMPGKHRPLAVPMPWGSVPPAWLPHRVRAVHASQDVAAFRDEFVCPDTVELAPPISLDRPRWMENHTAKQKTPPTQTPS